MSQSALYAGSFDPITLGHFDLIKRISLFFQPFVILVAHSNWKSYHFSAQKRVELIKKSVENLSNASTIEVDYCKGLVSDYARKRGIRVLIRGVRGTSDFEFEMDMSNANKELFEESETFIAFTRSKFTHCSSKLVKEIAKNGGDISHLAPPAVCQAFL